jgi:hypothetical protein
VEPGEGEIDHEDEEVGWREGPGWQNASGPGCGRVAPDEELRPRQGRREGGPKSSGGGGGGLRDESGREAGPPPSGRGDGLDLGPSFPLVLLARLGLLGA